MIYAISILLGSAWGRLGGSGYEGMDKQGLRSFCNPLQIACVKAFEWHNTMGWWFWVILGIYVVWQWGMIQGFSYGVGSPVHDFVEKVFGGKGADGKYMPVEYATRLICAMFWCLPSIAFCLFKPFWHWGLFYIIGITLIPLIGTFIKKADWSEMLVWGIFTVQVLI